MWRALGLVYTVCSAIPMLTCLPCADPLQAGLQPLHGALDGDLRIPPRPEEMDGDRQQRHVPARDAPAHGPAQGEENQHTFGGFAERGAGEGGLGASIRAVFTAGTIGRVVSRDLVLLGIGLA